MNWGHAVETPAARPSLVPVRVLWVGALVMLLHDLVGATSARILAIPIAWFYPMSMLIWGAVGYFSGRERVASAIVAGGTLGVIDTTIGWSISSAINGGGPQNAAQAVGTLVSMVLLAAACALAGAGIRKAFRVPAT